MKKLARIIAVSLLGIPLLAAPASGQHDMAFDFRMTDSGTAGMQTINGTSTGRAIVSKGRVRLDARGTARTLAMPGSAPGDDVTMIILDSGKTIIYANPKTKQYMHFDPMEAMDRMQKAMEGMGASMKFDFTGDPKIEDLGAGPVILGHKTQHYRATMGMTMTMNMMGESQTMEMSAVTAQYLAHDLRNLPNPFASMSSSATSGMMGGANKAYIERLKAVQAKLPHAMELRAESQVTISGAGSMGSMKNVREITGIKETTASNAQFTVPAGYTKVDLPMPGGRVPPE